jgi:ABC-2 type transport system ATP-binding protein
MRRRTGQEDYRMIATEIERRNQLTGVTISHAVAQLKGVRKQYGKQTALNGVDFSIGTGEVVALLGPNGAGKTTLVRLLLGLASPTEGTVEVFGRNPKLDGTRTRTGAMLQVGKVPETLRVHEHIDLFSSYYPSPLPLAEVLAIAGLKGLEKRAFGELSGGEKQRVLFALAICGNPDLLFLDEPTVGLDVESRRAMWNQIRHLVTCGKTVLLTTHYLAEADALATRIAIINHGRIIANGTPEDIKAKTLGKRVRCVTSLPISAVQAWPWVTSVRTDRGAMELHTTQAEALVRELLSRDPSLTGLEISSGGMEEAFLALTNQAH